MRLLIAVIGGFAAALVAAGTLAVQLGGLWSMEEAFILALMTMVAFLIASALFLGGVAAFAEGPGAVTRAAIGCALCVVMILGALAVIGWVRGASASLSVGQDGRVFLTAGLSSLLGIAILWWFVRWAVRTRKA